MVKKQVNNNKSAKSKAEDKKAKKAEIEEEIQEIDNNSIPDDSSSDNEGSEQVPSTQENKKSRHTAVEKNIEALESMDRTTGVIYLGHLPWGFDDVGIKKYFEQFGKITRILVPRSKRVNFKF
jgi:nucleolar protein 15